LGEGWDEGELLKVNANAKVVDPNKQTQNQQPKIKGAHWHPLTLTLSQRAREHLTKIKATSVAIHAV